MMEFLNQEVTVGGILIFYISFKVTSFILDLVLNSND